MATEKRGSKRAPPEATAFTNRNFLKNIQKLASNGLQNVGAVNSNQLGNKPFKNAGVEAGLIKMTIDKKMARQGLFAYTGTRIGNRNYLTEAEIEDAHRLAHWNASHEAAASGSFAEGPAIIAGIQTWAGGPTRSRLLPDGKTTRYTRRSGNAGFTVVDVVDCHKINGRTNGVNPLNMVFKEFIPSTVLPWHISVNDQGVSYTNRRGNRPHLHYRDAHATYFQKSRIDWNLLKIWCGASLATLDGTEPLKNETRPRKAATLPVAYGGDLSENDIIRLRSGIIQGMWPHVSDRDDGVKNNQLKNIIKSIVEKEPSELKEDSKGAKDGENDIEVMRRVIINAGTKLEHIKGESKVSTGSYEVYPGEAAQLFKKHVADNLYLNCKYPATRNSPEVNIKLIHSTRNFFAAWGVGCFKEDYEFTPMNRMPGAQVRDGPRKTAIQTIVRNFQTLFGANGGGWRIERLGTPGLGRGFTRPNRANHFFPYCDYSAVYTSILIERARVEQRLGERLGTWSARRIAKLIVNPVTSDAFFAGLWEADQLYTGTRAAPVERGSAYFQQKHAIDIYGNLAKEFRYQLGGLMNGMTVGAIEAIYKKGGGSQLGTIENRQFDANWFLGSVSRGVRNGNVERPPYFVRRGPGAAMVGVSGLITQSNTLKKGIKPELCAFYIEALLTLQAYIRIQYDKIKEIPPDAVKPAASHAIRSDLVKLPLVTIDRVTPPELMDFAKHFVVGLSEIQPTNNKINGINIYVNNRPAKGRRNEPAAPPRGRPPAGGARTAARAAARATPNLAAATMMPQVLTARREFEAATAGGAGAQQELARLMAEGGDESMHP